MSYSCVNTVQLYNNIAELGGGLVNIFDDHQIKRLIIYSILVLTKAIPSYW